MCPRTTACNHLPSSGMGSCMRRRSSAFTAFSFACDLLRIVCRNTVKRPLLLILHADVRKAQEGERLRLPFSTPLPVVDRIRIELQQPPFLGMQLQVELPHLFSPENCERHLSTGEDFGADGLEWTQTAET